MKGFWLWDYADPSEVTRNSPRRHGRISLSGKFTNWQIPMWITQCSPDFDIGFYNRMIWILLHVAVNHILPTLLRELSCDRSLFSSQALKDEVFLVLSFVSALIGQEGKENLK